MPADLKNPFGESCCDGSACSTTRESARSCGCDPGANWVCHRHQAEAAEVVCPRCGCTMICVVCETADDEEIP